MRLALEGTAVMLVAATPFAGLLELFVAVPLGIMALLCGVECAGACRRRPRRPRHR